jgi:hypothetical protein
MAAWGWFLWGWAAGLVTAVGVVGLVVGVRVSMVRAVEVEPWRE